MTANGPRDRDIAARTTARAAAQRLALDAGATATTRPLYPGTEHVRRYGRSFTRHCPSCDNTISDRGRCSGPADGEHGYARTCHQAAIDAWDTGWEAGQ